MKPREILRKIIEEDGNCCWVGTDVMHICVNCPLQGPKSCPTTVAKLTGGTQDAHYLEAAVRVLNQLEVERILLGDQDDT